MSYTLDVNVEQLQLIANARNGTGNNLSNTLDGNDLSNILSGESGPDRLLGMGAADRLLGGGGADFLDGGVGNDILIGADILARGRNEIDTLIGGIGADRFILGDARGRFYDEGILTNAGRADYVLITDFTVGQDKLQLDGVAANYFLGASGVANVSGSGLFHDSNANARLDANDELIAIMRSANGTTLNAANMINTAVFV